MKSTVRLVQLLSASLLIHCGAQAGGDISNTTTATNGAAIEGGTADNGDPAVGFLWLGDGFCSGSLIAPNVVLTAGHCVDGEQVEGFYIGNGQSTSENSFNGPPPNTTRYAALAQLAHPDYVGSDDCPNTTPDLALIRIEPVTGVTPLQYATSTTFATGDSCNAIGFGLYNKTVEAKRKDSETVTGSGATYVETTWGVGMTDSGDSGGPLLCGGFISGTTSCGPSPTKNSGIGYYGRVDAVSDWIASTVASWATAQ